MDASEVAIPGRHLRESAFKLLLDLIGLILKPFGSVLRQLHHRRMRTIPIARTVLIEIRRGAGETAEGVAIDGWGLAREDAGQLDALIVDTAIRRVALRRGADVDGASSAAGSGEAAEVRNLTVNADR